MVYTVKCFFKKKIMYQVMRRILMEENVFSKRLGDIYDYSPLKYMSGEAVISSETQAQDVHWELCLDVSGETHLQISYSGIPLRMKNFTLTGETEDKQWFVESKKVYIVTTNHNSEGLRNTIYCKTPEINFSKKQCDLEIQKAEVFITNFDFLGSEYTIVDNHHCLNKIPVSLPNVDLQLILGENYKAVKELLQIRRISKAILSKMIVSSNQQITMEELNKEINQITLFLSSITLNTNYEQMINYFNDEELVAIKIIDTIKMDFHPNVLVDNHIIRGGINYAFDNIYQEFNMLSETLRLRSYVNRIIDMQQQRFIDNKLAHLIIAYESLLTDFLIYKGATEKEISEINIQQKLGKLNRELQFIPKDLLGENLRELRNPLFHTGTIPLLDITDSIDIYSEYNNLLMEIFLRILSYDGEFLSRIDYQSTTV